MKTKREVFVDGYTRFCLAAIVVLLAALVLCAWVGQGPMIPAANAETATEDANYGDAAAQRKAMVKVQEQTNARLDDLIKLLKSGEVKVQVSEKGGGSDASK